MIHVIKSLPVIGPICRAAYRRWWKKPKKPPVTPSYTFVRDPWNQNPEPPTYDQRDLCQIQNLLNYTKTSGSWYAATQLPAGYHTIELHGQRLHGQRDPHKRLDLVPFDFRGKSVLDIGSNQGGMLFVLRDQIAWGVGIDYDHRMVNAANRMRSSIGAPHLDFYVFDLVAEDLQLIRDLLPAEKVDIAFLLSVCKWIPNWRDVIDFTADVAETLLFESNGARKQQDEQVDHLTRKYDEVTMLTGCSEDDAGGHRDRRFYLCQRRQPATGAATRSGDMVV